MTEGMCTKTNALSIKRGDTARYYFYRRDADGKIITSVADSVYITFKRNYTQPEVALQKSLADGTITYSGSGKYSFELTEDDTKNLGFGDYVLDIETTAYGVVHTSYGSLKIMPEATWARNKEN